MVSEVIQHSRDQGASGHSSGLVNKHNNNNKSKRAAGMAQFQVPPPEKLDTAFGNAGG